MTPLAYLDVRPFLFIVGLPLFVCLWLCAAWMTGRRWKTGNVITFSAMLFAALFVIFLTELGPFVGRKELREFPMKWQISPKRSDPWREAEVILTFVDFPAYTLGEYSDELATHLQERGEQPVKVVFEVTRDYGKVRGFNPIEIAGLRSWKSRFGYAGVNGTPSSKSPWD